MNDGNIYRNLTLIQTIGNIIFLYKMTEMRCYIVNASLKDVGLRYNGTNRHTPAYTDLK